MDSPARSGAYAASLRDTNSVKSRTRFVLRVSPCVKSQSVPYMCGSVPGTLTSRGSASPTKHGSVVIPIPCRTADRSHWFGPGEICLRDSRRRRSWKDGAAQEASSSRVSTFFANLPPCLVGLEASNGAHFWAQALSDLGHDVRLISPQFVTPYVKSNKNGRNDAEAIREAVGRPNMRFVPVKSPEQLAVQAVHRIRSRLVADRVRLVNRVRGLLGEHGIVVAKDIGNLQRALARIVGDNEDHALHDLVRSLMGELREELIELDARIGVTTERLESSIATGRSASASARSKGSAR